MPNALKTYSVVLFLLLTSCQANTTTLSQRVIVEDVFKDSSEAREIVILNSSSPDMNGLYETTTILWLSDNIQDDTLGFSSTSKNRYDSFSYANRETDMSESNSEFTLRKHFIFDCNEDGINDILVIEYTEAQIFKDVDTNFFKLGKIFWVERVGKADDYIYDKKIHKTSKDLPKKKTREFLLQRLKGDELESEFSFVVKKELGF